MISNSLDIDFIHGRSYKKKWFPLHKYDPGANVPKEGGEVFVTRLCKSCQNERQSRHSMIQTLEFQRQFLV